MNLGRILKIIGGTAIGGAQGFTAGGLFGAIFGGILAASQLVNAAGAEKKAKALEVVAEKFPHADPAKVGPAVDLIVGAMKLLEAAQPEKGRGPSPSSKPSR
jgi:hypothetical protein